MVKRYRIDIIVRVFSYSVISLDSTLYGQLRNWLEYIGSPIYISQARAEYVIGTIITERFTVDLYVGFYVLSGVNITEG